MIIKMLKILSITGNAINSNTSKIMIYINRFKIFQLFLLSFLILQTLQWAQLISYHCLFGNNWEVIEAEIQSFKIRMALKEKYKQS